MARLDVSTLWIALLLTSSSWAHQPEQHRVARRRDPHGSGMRTQLRHQALEAKRQAQADPEADGLPEVYMTSSTVTPSGTGTPSVVSWWELPYTNPTTTAVKSVWDPAEIAEAMHSIAQDQQLAKDPQPTGDSLWGAQGDSSSSSSSKDWMPSSEDDSWFQGDSTGSPDNSPDSSGESTSAQRIRIGEEDGESSNSTPDGQPSTAATASSAFDGSTPTSTGAQDVGIKIANSPASSTQATPENDSTTSTLNSRSRDSSSDDAIKIPDEGSSSSRRRSNVEDDLTSSVVTTSSAGGIAIPEASDSANGTSSANATSTGTESSEGIAIPRPTKTTATPTKTSTSDDDEESSTVSSGDLIGIPIDVSAGGGSSSTDSAEAGGIKIPVETDTSSQSKGDSDSSTAEETSTGAIAIPGSSSDGDSSSQGSEQGSKPTSSSQGIAIPEESESSKNSVGSTGSHAQPSSQDGIAIPDDSATSHQGSATSYSSSDDGLLGGVTSLLGGGSDSSTNDPSSSPTSESTGDIAIPEESSTGHSGGSSSDSVPGSGSSSPGEIHIPQASQSDSGSGTTSHSGGQDTSSDAGSSQPTSSPPTLPSDHSTKPGPSSSSAGDASPSQSSSDEDESSQKPTSNFYDFVTTSNLVLNTHKPSSTSSTPTSSAQEHTSQSHSTGNSEPSQQVDSAPISSVLPANLPSKIVPGDGAAQLQSLDNVTLVSMLFYTDQLSWAFLCDSSDTVAQIFQYGPEMVASVLNITSSDISNNALIAYQKLDAKSVNDIAAVYLMYVPTDAVDSLQQLVYSTKSKFYKQTGISGQIASQVDPSLKLNAFVSSDSTSVGDSKQNAEEDDDDGSSNKTTIVAVCASFGGVIALLLAALAFRHYKNKHPKDGAPNLRELQLSPDQPSPFMSQRSPGYGGGNTRISGATMQSQHMSSRPTSYGSEQSYDSDAIDPMTRDPRTRGISWYSGHYTDWDGEEPQTIYGAAISDDQHSPFSDQQRISGGSSEAWQRRDEGVRRLKTGQVTISRPTLAGNSLMI